MSQQFRDGQTQPTPVVHPPAWQPTQQQQPPQSPSPYTHYTQPGMYQQQFPTPPPPRKPSLLQRTDTKSFLAVLAIVIVLLGLGGAYALSTSSHTPLQVAATPDLTATSEALAQAQANATAQEATSVAAWQATQTAQPNTPVPSDTPTSVPTQQPTPTTPPNPQGDVGVTQQSGIWTLTVNSVKTSTGDQFDTPKSGDIYVIVNVTALNTDSVTHTINGIFFVLIDSQGNNYDQTFIASQQKNYGDVVAGQKLRGDTVFEVPTSLTSFTLQFEDSITSSPIVQWNLSV